MVLGFKTDLRSTDCAVSTTGWSRLLADFRSVEG